MDFKDQYPDFASIEGHIRHARAERAVALATLIANAILGTARGIKRFAAATGSGLAAERDRRAEADTFLKRPVAKY